jgi:exodeoxyribonuclease VII large subunit
MLAGILSSRFNIFTYLDRTALLMLQLPFFQPPTWSVTDLTRYLRDMFESDDNLADLWVAGEVSNLSRPASGHLYFTLKDRQAALRCVMWRNSVARQIQLPQNGDAVEVHGNISIYEASGNYQLYAHSIRPAGEGALYQEFLHLKNRLEAEGLFDPQHKRPLPSWPVTIGIVTSPTGAALQDILNTISRRYPIVRVILAPSQVQGEAAPEEIIAALEALNRHVEPDVILLARGGGSIEDLSAFNDESVARAIIASQKPVITGIGHETDFTIADFTADMRAATPTAAAELATPDMAELHVSLAELSRSLGAALDSLLHSQKRELDQIINQMNLRTPMMMIHRDIQRLDELSNRLSTSVAHTIDLIQTRLGGLELRLNALNPNSILRRGYSLVTQPDGSLINSVNQVQPEDLLQVRVSDGEFGVRVEEPDK